MAQNESAGAGSISSQDLGISDSDQDISLDSIGKKGKRGKAGKQAKQAKKGKSRKADDEEKPLNKQSKLVFINSAFQEKKLTLKFLNKQVFLTKQE